MKNVIAIYLRLSAEDEEKDDPRLESESISNQRSLIHQYIEQHSEFDGWEIREFADDGFSGANEDRPAFQQLILQAKNRAYSVIAVKDFSRFARNYITVGEYLEQVFPFLGIRFISINDHYDSQTSTSQADNMSMILKSILNAYYCKEISKKIRATYDMNMRNHQSIRIAPFGYTVNEDHTGFVIDPEPAETVREIYRLSLSGLNFSDITRVLNNNHVLTPTSYNMMSNWKRTGVCGRIDTTYWSSGTVSNILRDPVYTGRLTLHKVAVTVPSSRKIRKIDPSEQYVFEDAHEPIISKEDFAKVQELHPPRKSPGKRKRYVAPHILRGYVFCGVCKKGLIPTSTRNASYYCPTTLRADADCRQDAIAESELDQAVLSALLPLLGIFCSLPDKSNQTQVEKWLSECQKEILQNQVKQEGLQRMKLDLYEQYTSGNLPLLSYQQQKQSLNHEIQELKRAEAKLREQETTLRNGLIPAEWETISHAAERFRDTDVLTKEMADIFIDRIDVYPDYISIKWRFQDIWEKMLAGRELQTVLDLENGGVPDEKQ